MSRDWRLHLDDIADAAEKISRFVAGQTFAEFVADDARYDAVLLNLQIIGEAAKQLPEGARRKSTGQSRRDSGTSSPIVISLWIPTSSGMWPVHHVPEIHAAAQRLAEQPDGERPGESP